MQTSDLELNTVQLLKGVDDTGIWCIMVYIIVGHGGVTTLNSAVMP